MIPHFLPDVLCFALAGSVVLGVLHFTLLENRPLWFRLLAWAGWIGVVLATAWAADQAQAAEAQRLQEMVEGFPPTYAAELQRLGHEQLTSSTAQDDPIYLNLIEAQKRWLQANRSINDVYTFRQQADGSVVLVVDSETDYDRDGKITGETEERTALYTVYSEVDPELLECFATQRPTFSKVPYADKWGTWVSAYAPLLDASGKMEAVVGVDFSATTWISSQQRARLSVLSYSTVGCLAILGVGLIGHGRLHQVKRSATLREAELDRAGKVKFQSLVNAISGVVWERKLPGLEFVFVSPQVTTLFGQQPEEWLSSSWIASVHPDDSEKVRSQLTRSAATAGDYELQYRLCIGQRTHWVRETGTHVPATVDSPAALRGVLTDVSLRIKAQEDLEKTQRQLVDASRKAGMAEVASGVLHNVGNVLNSINVSSSLIHDTLRQSRVESLGKLAHLLQEQQQRLGYFITEDARGKAVPSYIASLAEHLTAEQRTLRSEVEGLVRNVEHIKDIIVMQQDYARVAGRMEPLHLRQVVEDALEVSNTSFYRHRITVQRRFAEVPKVLADRHKLLQILINLIRNAKHALEDSTTEQRTLVLEVTQPDSATVQLRVVDNGIGIAEENLKRIFNHGFTTKDQGHGFGLHSSAIAAREMGGSLIAHSPGPGQGAAFTLTVPAQPVPAAPALTA